MKEKKPESGTGAASDEGTQIPSLSVSQLLLKATGLSLVFVAIFLIITAGALGIFAYSKLSKFLAETNLSFSEAKSMFETGTNIKPPTTNNRTIILILGLDTVSNKSDAPPLTDTMLLLSIDYETGNINLLSLPRDLWSDAYKTKINALYYYGQEKYPNNPQQFPTEVVSEITGVPINYTVVFSLDSIAQIVDILGGLKVDVPTTFTDTEFPREDVDIKTTTDSAQLYETVTFTQGTEIMTSDRVKKYIRSRHSEGDTGTDLDRAARQQLIITSIIETITSRDVLTNPSTMASLFNWYTGNLSPYIPVTDAISIAYTLLPVRDAIVLTPNSLPIKSEDTEGVIEHLPPIQTDNQWTYSITEKEAFKASVSDILF